MGVRKYYNLLREVQTADNIVTSEVSNSKGTEHQGSVEDHREALVQSMHPRTSELSVKGGGSHLLLQAGGAGKKIQRLCWAKLEPQSHRHGGWGWEDRGGQGQRAQPYSSDCKQNYKIFPHYRHKLQSSWDPGPREESRSHLASALPLVTLTKAVDFAAVPPDSI